jgi:phage tail sheath protein FI
LRVPVQTSYPGVYIEERPSGVHSIAGVSTSVTAFVGAAGQGPVDEPVRVFSVADYARTFGPPLDAARPMGHAVAQFFANGGGEAVIVRAVAADALAADVTLKDGAPADALTLTAAGKGDWANRVGGSGLEVSVDHAGTANPEDLFTLVVSSFAVDPRTNQSVKAAEETFANVSMSPAHPRYVLNAVGASRLVRPALAGGFTPATAKGTSVGQGATGSVTITPIARTIRVAVDFGPPVDVVLFATEVADVTKTAAQIVTELNTNALPNAGLPQTAVKATQAGGIITLESQNGGMNSAVTVTPSSAGDLSQALKLGLVWGGHEISGAAAKRPAPVAPGAAAGFLDGGSDGSGVLPADIVPSGGATTGMRALDALRFPRFNLLCLPGVTSADQVPIGTALSYCGQERAFLVVDSPADGFAAIPPVLGSITALGEHGALYYPRLEVVEQTAGGSRTLNLPACGAVAGVMARTDAARGIWKAPAGLEAGIVGATGLSNPTGAPPVDDHLSGQLNPHGINVLRSFPAAGMVVWGARTLRGDDTLSSEFKYVPVRRLTDYLASSLYLGTQFAVFEPNDPDLWGQLRLAVGTFMRTLFRQGAFQQSEARTESDSFFVICDETVNPQSEIDLGRVNVVVGFAPLKPAEFVIVTITQISQLEA